MKIIVSEQHKMMVLPAIPAVTNLFPDAVPINDEHVAVSHGPRECILLRRAGYHVPNPLLNYYDWANGQPFAVQKSTAALLTSNTRAYVLSDMGTGKTRSALWAWDYLYRTGCAQKLLVVAKLRSLKFTWLAEIRKTLPHVHAVVLHGSKQKRLEMLADENASVFIINHDGVKTIRDELHMRLDIDCLVLDESAVYRNASARQKLMRQFAQRFTWVWAMTGSPMPQRPTDVWGQAVIVTPHTVPRYRGRCMEMLETRIDEHTWKPKPDAVTRAYEMLQPAVRFALSDVVELPPAIERTIEVELSPEQSKVYKAITRDFIHKIEQKIITAANAGVAMNKLLQVAGGWVYTTQGDYVSLDNAARVEELIDLIEEAEHKVIIWVPYKHAMTELQALLTKHFGREVARVDGDTPKADEVMNDFQNTTRYHELLAHPACLSHSVTLTAADTTIWWQPPLGSYDQFQQANARIRRIGQEHKQQFLFMTGSPVERKLYKMLQGREAMQDAYLDLIKSATEEMKL